MSTTAPGGNGSDDTPAGPSPVHHDRARAGRGLVIVIVAVVLGVLLLPSATRAPLLVGAVAPTTTPRVASTGTTKHHHASTTTTTAPAPATIHLLVANATVVNGVAHAVTAFLAAKGFATLTPTNALLKVTASELYTVGGATADTSAVATALDLPASSIEPAASAAPVASTTGANVVVIVGPDLAARFNPATTTTAG